MTAQEVSFSARKQIFPLLIICAFTAGVVLVTWVGIVPLWLGLAVVVVLTCVIGIGVYNVVRCARTPPVLRFDESGVTVRGAPLVPWTDLREVVIQPMQPSWLRSTRLSTVMAFVPRPGVSLPGPPHYGGPLTFARERRISRYGTNLIIMPSTLSASSAEIAHAVESLGGVPTRRVRDRLVRRWLVIFAAAVGAGIVAGVISALLGSA